MPIIKPEYPAATHNYAYSFEPKSDWPNYYATSKQIHQYMCDISAKYHVDECMKFNHEIKNASWDDSAGKWRLTVQNCARTFQDECDIFINAGGVLNKWKYPNIEGLHDFKGKLMHSAAWDASYDFTDKRVAVIGIGSSGIQILPQLAPLASHLTSFVRSQCWVSPAPGINEPTPNDPEMDDDYNYAPEVLERFKNDPKYLQEHRQQLADRRIQNFMRSWDGTDLQLQAQALFAKSMKQRLGDSPKAKEIERILIPSFPVGCRRQTPGPGFLESLMCDNVDLRWDDISKITPTGIQTKSGSHLDFDVIICATGFDTSFRPSFPITGLHGTDLAQKWDDGAPEAYFSITIPGFPNYFTFIGPNSPISNGSLVQGIQITGIYIYNCISKLQTESIKSMSVSQEAADEYNEHTQEYLKRTVWVSHCRSWYKRGTTDGQVVAIYAGTSFHFIEALRKPRWEDYRFEYLPCGKEGRSRSRFAYLGDGFTVQERANRTVGATQTLDFDEYWDLMVLPDVYE